ITAEAASTLDLSGGWSNAGIITATDATVNLGGVFAQTALGTFNHAGSTVNLTGTLSGGLALTAQTGSWRLTSGSKVQGGTITASGGAQVVAAGGTLEG